MDADRDSSYWDPRPGAKRVLPRSLLGRSLLIIVTPLILLQIVTTGIFFESHWDRITSRLARSLAGDVAMVVASLRDAADAEARDVVFDDAFRYLRLSILFHAGDVLPNEKRDLGADTGDRTEQVLSESLRSTVKRPFSLDMRSDPSTIRIQVQLPDGVLDVTTPSKRIFSSTTYVFVLWTVGISLILLGIAITFMRNQVRPIRRLAEAADNFGKGRDVAAFKLEGATEVRQAASAFLAMRARLQRQLQQRTEMLAGVSHDLRTPLTRMKLQLAMLRDDGASRDLQADITEMEHMLEAYLAFARGEGTEKPETSSITDLVAEVAEQARRQGRHVVLEESPEIALPLRPNAMKRCLTNLVDNAARYGGNVWLRVARAGKAAVVTVDDDGPGIPEDRREDVFKPFFRLDDSRNPETGGTGLGLSIAKDIVRSHGGELDLADSPKGGLRVRLALPL